MSDGLRRPRVLGWLARDLVRGGALV